MSGLRTWPWHRLAAGVSGRRRSVMVIGILAVALASVSHGQNRDTGRIQGLVQQQGQRVANHRIMLIRFGPAQDVQRTPGQTDAEGRFSFENLATGVSFQYVVGVRYDEQLYRSEPIVLGASQSREDVVVDVGKTGTKALEEPGATSAQVHIIQHIMAVVRRRDRVEVREIVSLRNPAATPYQGDARGRGGPGAVVLHLPLPEGYEDLREVQGWGAEHVRSDATGLSYTSPLPPGAHRIIYSYALPMQEAVRTLLLRHALPTEAFDIFVDTRQLVATIDIPYQGRIPIESHIFFHFRGTQLAPNARSWLQLTRLQAGSTSFLKIGSYGLVVTLALLGVLIPLYGLRYSRARVASALPPTIEQIRRWQVDYDHLLQTIAALDNAWEAGTVAEDLYRDQRKRHKDEALELAQHLRRARHVPETGLIAAQREPE